MCLLSADHHDLDCLKLKKGHVAIVREAAKSLQIKHGEGPLRTPVSTGCGDMVGPDLARLLGSLTVMAEGAQAQQRTAGGCHQIAAFVSSSLFAKARSYRTSPSLGVIFDTISIKAR